MKDYHLKKCERETVININDAEPVAYLSTSQQWMKNRIKKLAESRPDEVKIKEEDEYILFAQFPKKWIRISLPRTVSEEQRQKAAERFREYHEKKRMEAGSMDVPDVNRDADECSSGDEDMDNDFLMDMEDTDADADEGEDERREEDDQVEN